MPPARMVRSSLPTARRRTSTAASTARGNTDMAPFCLNEWPTTSEFEIANGTTSLIKLRPMSSPSGNSDDEHNRVHRCLQGDPAALAALREAHHSPLFNILRARGASRDETEELLADLWGDCVPANG